ncbi:hypothetical protein [Bosea lathyri]|uniref:hypothetical protein n=1 Tax=Bosea lathyri TaxID=1036778 RepID=UPI001359B139|nr:hypothetical protein [Bosea lathyri]
MNLSTSDSFEAKSPHRRHYQIALRARSSRQQAGEFLAQPALTAFTSSGAMQED